MMNIFGAIALIVTAFCIADTCATQGEMRTKRSFHSYFENYLDEMANSACVAMGTTGGLYFAVRRKCRNGPTCHQICTSESIRKQSQIWDKTKKLNTRCVESFHVYKHRPSLADNKNADTDTMKVGMTIYKYKSCHVAVCGPNYCCCTGPQN